jgi:acetyl-CoA carboxylase carboxyltransferase component
MSGRLETVTYLPQSNKESTTLPYELNDEVRTKLATIIPIIPTNRMICTRLLVELLKDSFEVHKNYAENILVGFARLGKKHWIIANQPMILAGCLDVNSSKAARFTRFAIVLIFRYWFWWMYRDFYRERIKNGTDYRSRCEIVLL